MTRFGRGSFVGGDFARSVVTLLTGTAIAQALPILASPVLTRLYSPAMFGSFALFTSLTAIAGILVTGRYELAILLPEDDDTAASVAAMALGLSVLIGAVGVLFLALAGPFVVRFLGDVALSGWIYLIPVGVTIAGAYQTLYYWTNRHSRYRLLSASRMSQTLMATGLSLLLGVLGVGVGGLVVSGIAGQTAGLVFLAWPILRRAAGRPRTITWRSVTEVAKQYKRFPIYSMPADIVSTTTHQLPTLLLSRFFGPGIVGLYALTQRVVAAPVTLLAGAVLDVFKQRASREYATGGNCRSTFVRTFNTLLLIAVPTFAAMVAVAPPAFAFFFGEQWREAGRYAQIIGGMYLIRFVSSPLSFTFFVAGRQGEDLTLQVYLVASTFLVMTLAHRLGATPMLVLTAFAANLSAVYLLFLIRSYTFSRGPAVAWRPRRSTPPCRTDRGRVECENCCAGSCSSRSATCRCLRPSSRPVAFRPP
jgi:O-antigen/teichoic acid export membrane protein